MADIMKSMDSVYEKWQKKSPTVNGKKVPQRSESYNGAVEDGRKAWKSKFKELPPQPERRTRKAYTTRRSKQIELSVSFFKYSFFLAYSCNKLN